MAVVSAGTGKDSHVITPPPHRRWKGQCYNYTVEWKSGDPELEPAPLNCLCFQTLTVGKIIPFQTETSVSHDGRTGQNQ